MWNARECENIFDKNFLLTYKIIYSNGVIILNEKKRGRGGDNCSARCAAGSRYFIVIFRLNNGYCYRTVELGRVEGKQGERPDETETRIEPTGYAVVRAYSVTVNRK